MMPVYADSPTVAQRADGTLVIGQTVCTPEVADYIRDLWTRNADLERRNVALRDRVEQLKAGHR